MISENIKKRPLIAITAGQNGQKIQIDETYYNAIYSCGGIPSALARTDDIGVIRSYAETFDGFLFTGGVDVDPKRYGEEISADNVVVDASRDSFEFLLLSEVLKLGKPILGICRGLQTVNVGLGGSLFQDIRDHRSETPGVVCTHGAKASGRLASLVGGSAVKVNSFHHQAAKKVSEKLKIAATSDDGTIEALVGDGFENTGSGEYILLVQWHPERMFPESRAIFEDFIKAAEDFGKR